MIVAARATGMLTHPALVAAIRWRSWLHPRGKNGRFIEKFSLVNVFANGSDRSYDRTADRRRGRITKLTPQGALVEYFDDKGKKIPADPSKGYPEFFTQDEISDKLSLAPKHIARIPDWSDEDEWTLASPARSRKEHLASIAAFNEKLDPAKSHDTETGEPLDVDSAEWKEHRAYVEATLNSAFHEGLSASAFLKDNQGNWSEEAYAIFFDMVDTKLDEVEKRNVPKGRRSVILGGLPGAGKSTALRSDLLSSAGMNDDTQWAVTDADMFKEMLAAGGFIPKVNGLAEMEASSLVHEMSSEMAHMFGQALMAEGYNTIIDTTMGSSASDGSPSVYHTADDLAGYGYKVDAVFVEASNDITAERKEKRWIEGFNAKRTGRSPFGGRYTPINASRVRPDGRSSALHYFSTTRDKGMFDSWIVISSEEVDLQVVAQGNGPDVFDAYDATKIPGLQGGTP